VASLAQLLKQTQTAHQTTQTDLKMNKSFTLAVTTLNLALACWVLSGRPSSDAPVAPAPSAPQNPPRADKQAPITLFLPCMAQAAPAPPAFHWRQIETSDYRAYIQNLRGIGCPETTVRDIIIADVHALFQERRSQARCPRSTEFWRASVEAAALSQAEIGQLNAEEEFVLDTLLGPRLQTPAEDQSSRFCAELRFDPILQPKRAALEEWSRRFETVKTSLLAVMNQRDMTEAEVDQMRTLESEQELALNGLLTPSERAEFDVRNSPSAQYLRQSLLGFDVTEQEFRALFEARKEFDTQLSSTDGGENPLSARQMFQESAAKVLGPERFARFERAQEPEFQEFYNRELASGLESSSIEAQWEASQRQLAVGIVEQ
jgi:hypothetical protein